MELSRFLQIVLNFKRHIIGFALALSVIVFLAGSLFMKYAVETNVLIKPIGFQSQLHYSKSLTGLVSSPELTIMENYGNSYVQILTNRQLISEVVTRLELDKAYFSNQTLFTRLIDNLKQPLRFIKYGKLPATPKNPLEMAIGRVTKNIKARLHIKSSIIRLTVKDKDAHRAAAIANTLVESFLNYTKENNKRAAKTAMKFIKQHLVETRAELESNKNKLKKLKIEHGFFVFSDFSKEMEKIVKKLEDMEKTYDNNNFELEIVKDTLAKNKKEMSKYPEYKKSLYTLNSNPALRNLKSNLFGLKMELQKLLIDYSPQHLQVKNLKDRIAMTEKAISSEVERPLTREDYMINPIYKNLLLNQFSLEIKMKTLPFLNKLILERTKKYRHRLTELEAISKKISDVNDIISNLAELESQLLKDLYSARAIEARGLEEVQILDRAVAPRYPVIRELPLFYYVIMCFISGMILSSFLIILKTQLKGTIIDEEDIIKEGISPSIKTISSIAFANKKQRKRDKIQKLEKSNHLYPFFHSFKMEEEFRYLAGRFCCGGFIESTGSNCYCVTSSISKEGKTTVAANLAVALADISRKVVIVDCQNINPNINELFELEMGEGLTEYMKNPSSNMVDRIIVSSALKGLSVVTHGSVTNGGNSLFYDKEFNFLLRDLKHRFDDVILDCNSVLKSAGTLSIASNPEVNGVILIVQANRIRKADVLKTCNYIQSVNAELISVICNQI
jgi:Mrp family chromosome partitioning ATPase